jgi:hypothetical protein
MCHNAASQVPLSTISKHIKKPWLWDKKKTTEIARQYYFCSTPDCHIIYFDENNTSIKQVDLRTLVGIKDPSRNSLICYCFGVTKNEAIKSPAAKEFIIRQTKEKVCACEHFNPSGKCCLKDWPKIEKLI